MFVAKRPGEGLVYFCFLLDLRSRSLVMNAKSVEWDTNSDAMLLLFNNYCVGF